MKRQVLEFDSAAACAGEGAERLVAIALDSVERRGSFTIALSGGSSPVALFRELATGQLAGKFPWKATRFFFGDERCVPPDHPHSNYRSARENLFSPAGVDAGKVFRIQGELGPEEAARRYRDVLARELGDPPAFDAVLLGLGRDGHTASLFPGDPALSSLKPAEPVAPSDADPPVPRVTVSLSLINASRSVLFLVSGKGKEEVIRRILGDPPDSEGLPASMVAPRGPVTWLVCR